MDDHALRVLEFDKIVSRLAEQASSSLGRERAMALGPEADLDTIRRMQAETSEAKDILALRGTIPLGGITDIRPLVKKAQIEALLLPNELSEVAHTLGAARRLRSFLTKHAEEAPLLVEIAGRMTTFEKLEKQVEDSISPGGEVMDSASATLARVRSETKTFHSRIMDKLNSMIQSAQYRTAIQEPVITQREDRYCIPVKVEYRSQVRGIVHDASTSGATIFVEPEQVVEFGNELKRLAIKEREEVQKVLRELTGRVALASVDILTTVETLGEIDFIVSKAKLSNAESGTEPILNRDGWLRLVQARHPLLSGDVVPIDLELGRKFTALLITGPNTGGKTVTLKTIGILALMSQSGLHVPALQGTEIAIFDQIFADIGDEQSIEQSLSTFSSHIRNIVHVIKTIGPNALVLFDEIGAGTDPAEGAALAKSILEFVMKRGARVAATTHYGELKQFAFAQQGIQNASVEFDLETLRPTYRLMIGVPGSSNAFSIAARLGMPDHIVNEAQSSMSGRRDSTDEIIKRIEESHRDAVEDRRLAGNAAQEAETLRRRYEEKLKKVEQQREKAQDEIRRQGKQIVDKYTRRLEQTIEALAKTKEESKRSERLKHEAKEVLERVQDKVVQAPSPKEEDPLPEGVVFKKGDRVRIASLNQEGILIEDIADGTAVVAIGVMRVSVPESSLRPVQGNEERPREVPAPGPTGTSVMLTKAVEIAPEIMLRAQRAEAALYALDEYLYDAQTAGLTQVRVIHGKGTGALKNAVWQFLRNHPSVLSYELAEQSEGGSGATIVKLK